VIAGLALWLLIVKHERNYARNELAKVNAMTGAMAHEAKSPLATSYSYAVTVRDILALGVVKHENDHAIVTFPDDVYKDLQEFSGLSIEVAAYGMKAIDVILMNIKEEINGVKLELVSVLDSVNAAVNGYLLGHVSFAQKIIVDVSPDLKMMGSPLYVEQMVYNLIKNAFHHGGASVKVKVYNEGRDLIVEDDGRGIDPEIMQYIFDRFYAHMKNGTGVGLAFCKITMKAFGGSISCESEVGRFTKFVIHIPSVKA